MTDDTVNNELPKNSNSIKRMTLVDMHEKIIPKEELKTSKLQIDFKSCPLYAKHLSSNPSLEFKSKDITFEDLFLSEEQRVFFSQIVTSYKNADKLTQKGIYPVRSILLEGEHDTGRTSICCAMASELDKLIAFIKLEYLAVMPTNEAICELSKNIQIVCQKADLSPNGALLIFENIQALNTSNRAQDTAFLCHIAHEIKNIPANILIAATTTCNHSATLAFEHIFDQVICMEYPVYEQRLGIINSLMVKYCLPPVLKADNLAKFTEGLSYSQIKHIFVDAARKSALDDDLTNNDFAALIIRRLTKYTSNPDNNISVISEMLNRGVSIRTAAQALGVSHSTLEYQINKYRESMK